MIAVDSSVLIDMLSTVPTPSKTQTLSDAAAIGRLALSDVAMAEICSRGDSEQTRKTFWRAWASCSCPPAPKLPPFGLAKCRSATAEWRHRSRIIADFLIGAHALMQCGG